MRDILSDERRELIPISILASLDGVKGKLD